MKKKMSDFAFKLMTYMGMPIRNLFMPPNKILAEVGIKPGCQILDFGCGVIDWRGLITNAGG